MSTQPTCRLSGNNLSLVLDLGMQPLGNGFLDPDSTDNEYFFPLQCGFDEESRLFQLMEQPDPRMMFHDDYAFLSSTSQHMQRHFADLAETVLRAGYLDSQAPFVVELGSNDGIYLRHFAERGIPHLGVEPAGGVADVAESQGVAVLRDFFNLATAQQVRDQHGAADVISAANVMCHIPNIREMADAISLLLKPGGVLIFEDPYLGDVVQKASYDQIYDEHVFLFSAMSVAEIFKPVGLELINVEHLPTHGGSMRYTLGRPAKHSVADSVPTTIAREEEQGLNRTETYSGFALRVQQSARDLHELLHALRSEGRAIAAYGATSKSTTVYNYSEVSSDLIDYICDNTPTKIGKLSPGVHIPIVPEADFVENAPDVAFLGAWNHEPEIRSRNQWFEESGGRWISHVPKVRFLD